MIMNFRNPIFENEVEMIICTFSRRRQARNQKRFWEA